MGPRLAAPRTLTQPYGNWRLSFEISRSISAGGTEAVIHSIQPHGIDFNGTHLDAKISYIFRFRSFLIVLYHKFYAIDYGGKIDGEIDR